MNFEDSIVVPWTVAILAGVGALGLCALLAYVLAMLQTGWFNVVVLTVAGALAVAPAVLRLVRPRTTVDKAPGAAD